LRRARFTLAEAAIAPCLGANGAGKTTTYAGVVAGWFEEAAKSALTPADRLAAHTGLSSFS